ncbi:peptidase S8 and S53 subtilisin kexin sedolisin [Thermosipho africanus Ob7]|uniref:S8 family serine peptidase n=1 Tax=Thermosipho africanus TaxID=2421 RepID=UPI000E0B0624|nr:S8 family serine peptidase [Thermosipho africanus]RDI90932.1 peptidase S8 and S53 subtilisin kexin sedolisin [Thermosipho africanus Ob7]
MNNKILKVRELLKNSSGQAINICIIDSGIELSHDWINIKFLKTYKLTNKTENEYKIIESTKVTDPIGHGTAISFLISKIAPNARIFHIKTFDRNEEEFDKFFFALQWLYLQQKQNNIRCDILNLSLGFNNENLLEKMEDILSKLKETMIVLPYNNYHHRLKKTINIEISKKLKSAFQIEIIDYKKLLIGALGENIPVPWKENSYARVSGKSYACSIFTGLLARLKEKFRINTIEELEILIYKLLKEGEKRIK